MADLRNTNVINFDPKGAIRKANPVGQTRHSYVVAGPGGTGKSTLNGSMAEVLGADRILVLATLPREAESWKYNHYQVDRVLFTDPNWNPELGKYEASATPKLIAMLEYLRDVDDQYDGIILDNGTDAAEHAWHLALSVHKAASPAHIENAKERWQPYESLDTSLDTIVTNLCSLTTVAKRPKHVGISWHVQPAKEDSVEGKGDQKVTKESSDNRGMGVEYEGKILPMIRGKFRRKLITKVDAFVYSDILVKRNFNRDALSKTSIDDIPTLVTYRIQVRPDEERHTKLPGPLPEMQYIPNDFRAFRDLIESQKVADTQTKKVEAAVKAVAPALVPAAQVAGRPAVAGLSRK